MESFQKKLTRVLSEKIDIVAYNPLWPDKFIQEKEQLESLFSSSILKRIEHFGSTAVPGLIAKPIIDMLVEVSSLNTVKKEVVPVLESQMYDYFWRPTFGNNTPPFYAWFIKRDTRGKRTHHIHMVEKDFPQWERLLFRDYLRGHPDIAKEYGELKLRLAKRYGHNRELYTKKKGAFIQRVTSIAKEYFTK